MKNGFPFSSSSKCRLLDRTRSLGREAAAPLPALSIAAIASGAGALSGAGVEAPFKIPGAEKVAS
jgi:hypothetical protein